MITVDVRKTGVVRKAWRMRITGGNGEPLGHAYNRKESAVETAELMFGSTEPVRLRVYNSDGTVTETTIR